MTTLNTTSNATAGRSSAGTRAWVLLLGPALSVIAGDAGLARIGVGDEWATLMLATMLVMAWSPLFFSVPALLLQDARDETLVGATRWRRTVGLLPALLAQGSPVRREQLWALYGFAAGVGLLILV
jgi:hypothetical protein